MPEDDTLRSVVEKAIGDFCSANGFGMPNGFVYCVSRIDNSGAPCLTLGAMDGQMTHTSMGLTAYLAKNFDLDAEVEFTSYYSSFADDEDD